MRVRETHRRKTEGFCFVLFCTTPEDSFILEIIIIPKLLMGKTALEKGSNRL